MTQPNDSSFYVTLNSSKNAYSNPQVFLFNFRKCLQGIRSLPICEFTEWIYSEEQCTCRTRIGLLHVTIDDLCLFQQPFIENIEEVLDRFERTYAHDTYVIMNSMVFFIVDAVLV